MSVYKAKSKNGKSNKSWTAALDLGLDSKGKRRRVTRAANTKREATAILRELERTHLGASEIIDVKSTLGEYIHTWYEIKVRGIRRAKTASSYYYVLHHYVVPALGRKRLVDITSTDIARRLSALAEEGLAITTLKQIRVVLHKAFNDAVADGKILKNPVSAVPTPRVEDSEAKENHHRTFTRDEVLVFSTVLKDERIEAICLIAVTMGLRFGEILGLKWEDIESDFSCLSVRRTSGEVQVFATDGTSKTQIVSNPPKTSNGHRKLMTTALVRGALNRWRVRQYEDRLMLGEAWEDNDFVFTSAQGAQLWQSNVRRQYKRIIKESGLPDIRFHDLRHTAAVLMLVADARLEHVCEALGHSSIAITKDIYARSVPELADRAIDAIDHLLGDESFQVLPIAVNATGKNIDRDQIGRFVSRTDEKPGWRGK